MKHQVFGKQLNRGVKARKALFKNLINALIEHQAIKTTETKAKAIKGLVDKFVGRAKKNDLHSRRLVFAFLQNKKMVNKLFEEIAPKFRKRSSGFTRIIKLGRRKGDAAMMVKMEFVEGEEIKEESQSKIKSKREPIQSQDKDLNKKPVIQKTQKKKENKEK
jgi:large subunit ribosomal protein L17